MHGTGLMGPTNIIAHELKRYGVHTFSAKRWPSTSLVSCIPCSPASHKSSLSGLISMVEWITCLTSIADITTCIRMKLNKRAELHHAIACDNSANFKVINGVEAEQLLQTIDVLPRTNFCFDFSVLGSSSSPSDLSHLWGFLDLEKVIVITGFGKVGPLG